MQQMAYVYILLCADNSYYTGWTNNPRQRLTVHNQGKGAKYTRSRLPVRLIYLEVLADNSAAQKREYALKQLTHSQKTALLKADSNQLIRLQQSWQQTDVTEQNILN